MHAGLEGAAAATDATTIGVALARPSVIAGHLALILRKGVSFSEGDCLALTTNETAVGGEGFEKCGSVAFLFSDDSGYITGTALPVDGGYLAT